MGPHVTTLALKTYVIKIKKSAVIPRYKGPVPNL